MPESTLIILLAHGSSDPHWLQPFLDLEQRIRARESEVRLAFMELANPTLDEVVTQARQAGYRKMAVLPLFFAAGRHLRHDVPRQIEQLAHQLQVSIELLPPVGDHPLLAEAIIQIAGEAIQAHLRPES